MKVRFDDLTHGRVIRPNRNTTARFPEVLLRKWTLCDVRGDPQSKALKLSDRPAADLLFAASSKRPRSGIAVGSAGGEHGEHAPARDEDLVGDGHNGFVFALSSSDLPEKNSAKFVPFV